MRVRVLIVEFHVPLCAEHFVFITGPLFALFLNFPCLEVNLMPNNEVSQHVSRIVFPAVSRLFSDSSPEQL